jgi:hypothetical protein
MLDELNPWLKQRGGDACTKGYRCFDEWRRSCFARLLPTTAAFQPLGCGRW